jgi:hypothetical protein
LRNSFLHLSKFSSCCDLCRRASVPALLHTYTRFLQCTNAMLTRPNHARGRFFAPTFQRLFLCFLYCPLVPNTQTLLIESFPAICAGGRQSSSFVMLSCCYLLKTRAEHRKELGETLNLLSSNAGRSTASWPAYSRSEPLLGPFGKRSEFPRSPSETM